MKKKMISIACMMIICLLACNVPPTMADEDEALINSILKVKDKTAFYVAHSKEKGEPIAVIAAPGFSEFGRISIEGESFPLEEIKKLLERLMAEKKENFLKTVSSQTFVVHGSPGCYIKTASGDWVCICPK